MFHRNSFIFLCLILFLSISTPVFAAEEPDLSGGVITSIPRQRFLENINPTHFSTANDPADLISYLQEQLQNISSLTAIVSKDGQTYETELSLSWSDFPEDVTKYNLIVHCGGCMLNEREMRYRQKCALDQEIPITNYGIAIAYMQGILKRCVEMFPDVRKELDV